VAATAPGMLLIHDGQIDGARIRTPVEFGRRPDESRDVELRTFYDRLLDAVGTDAIRRGTPIRLVPRPTWVGDPTHAAFVAWLWMGPHRSLRLVVANLGQSSGRCFIPLGVANFTGQTVTFEDLLGDARYVRDGNDLLERGLFLELPPDGYHLFRIRALAARERSQGARE